MHQFSKPMKSHSWNILRSFFIHFLYFPALLFPVCHIDNFIWIDPDFLQALWVCEGSVVSGRADLWPLLPVISVFTASAEGKTSFQPFYFRAWWSSELERRLWFLGFAEFDAADRCQLAEKCPAPDLSGDHAALMVKSERNIWPACNLITLQIYMMKPFIPLKRRNFSLCQQEICRKLHQAIDKIEEDR